MDWTIAVYLFWVGITFLFGALILTIGPRVTFYFLGDQKAAEINNPGADEEIKKIEPSPTPEEQVKKSVMAGEFEEFNIGGASLIVKTLPNATEKEIAVIFEQIKDTEALVNVALAGKVKIEDVRLITENPQSDDRRFFVEIEVGNLTDKDIRIKIPEGQLFENKSLYANKKLQNLATIREDIITIPASSKLPKPVRIEAFCANKGFDPPNNPGNITIFELRRKLFVDQEDLWDWLDKNIDKSGSKKLLKR